MNWKLWLVSACVAVVGVSCGPPMVDPILEVTATPRSIRADGQKTVLAITATDATGKPGTGSVRIQSTIGSLKEKTTVELANGKAELDYWCTLAMDAECKGTARISAEWTVNSKLVEAQGSVLITAPPVPDAGVVDAGVDAGIDAGFDAGVDAGRVDDGGFVFPDAGLPDGGRIVSVAINPSVISLVRASSDAGLDSITVTATVKRNDTMATLPGVPVEWHITGGSLDASVPLPQKVQDAVTTTNNIGQATVELSVADETMGFSITARAFDGSDTKSVNVVRVEQIEQSDIMLTRTAINTQQAGMQTTTSVIFRVLNELGQPVPGVQVAFSILPGAAGGATIDPPLDRTDAMGKVSTLLRSGNEAGSVTVRATVRARPTVFANAQGISVRWGIVNDGRFNVSCSRKSIGALQTATAPRADATTVCSVSATDRSSSPVSFNIPVEWRAESGAVTAVTQLVNGIATMNFSAAPGLPVETTPLLNEPSSGMRNPRDRFTTIIASMPGEEAFFDSPSGSPNNNGRWDPGEWWVDLSEPFADANDNGIYDPGEPYENFPQFNCATGQMDPANTSWDGPNGCWDANTRIWASTHVVYTDALVHGPIPPFIEFSPPGFVPVGQTIQASFKWYDPYFNRLAAEGTPSLTIATISGTRGSATLTPGSGGESFGHDLIYETYRAELTSDGGITDLGPCTELAIGNTVAQANQRCFKRYRFGAFRTAPTGGTVTFQNPTAQMPMPDGGPPPTTSTYELRATNGFQASSSTFQWTVSLP